MKTAHVARCTAVIAFCVPLLASGQSQRPSPAAGLAAIPREVREEIDRLASNDAGKRGTGAASLGEMGAKAAPAIPYLARLTEDTTEVLSLSSGKTVGAIAAESLISIGPEGVQALIAQLTPGPPFHWGNAARALCRHKIAEALPPLAKLLSGQNVYDGLDVVRALGVLGDRRGVEPIMSFLMRVKDASKYPEYWQTALQQLTGQKFTTVDEATNWWDQNKGAKNQ